MRSPAAGFCKEEVRIMNKKALRVLEYDKILELLKAEAGSEMTRELISKLTPYDDIRTIREELRSTTEAVDLIVRKGPLPTGGLHDIVKEVQYAKKGGVLNLKQLLTVAYDIGIASRVVTFMKGSEVPEVPLISAMTDVIVTMPNLESEIERCILNEDELRDNASPELSRIRRSITRQNEAIRAKLDRLVNDSANRTYLQDSIVTVRDGRFVIPVKQEHRAHFPGIVHDQSKAGATLFIEPQAVVELNNGLRELELAEEAEIARILAELSSRVAEHSDHIRNNQELLLRLDFIMAKGKLSRKMDGEEPAISEDMSLVIRKGRHPLIDGKKVVPIDIRIGSDFRTLVVTGPNTGGKTVSLKTTGLLSLMAMSGLHIPAREGSAIPVYGEIFADIGDEQSIEQSLSTFSSHMRNIVEIVDGAAFDTLVLVDELGAGTDPTEGAALAIAILSKLYRNGACTIATTHYNELKKYALSTEGVQNASMEFDVETLSPTYKLLIGVAGRSNAFEISRKLGLPSDIIDEAGRLIERGDMEFEDVLSAIEEDRKQAERDRDEAAAIIEAARREKADIDAKAATLKEKREKIIEDARAEARDLIREARETASDVAKTLKELEHVPDKYERRKKLSESRARLREEEDKYASGIVRRINAEPVTADKIKTGDRVKILTLNQNGEVLTLPDSKGDLTVSIGMMKLAVNLKDIALINDGTQKKQQEKKTKYGGLYKSKAMSVSASINVQGKNLEDALMDVEKYIDDVYMAGLEKVTIIHGRGEGILKNGIRDMLRHNKSVKSCRAGTYNEGGEGVTIVTMRRS